LLRETNIGFITKEPEGTLQRTLVGLTKTAMPQPGHALASESDPSGRDPMQETSSFVGIDEAPVNLQFSSAEE
jgi:hypothetical protein